MPGQSPNRVDAARLQAVADDPAFQALREKVRQQEDALARANNAPQSDANRMEAILEAMRGYREASAALAARVDAIAQAQSTTQNQGQSADTSPAAFSGSTSSTAPAASTSPASVSRGSSGAAGGSLFAQLMKDPESIKDALHFLEILRQARVFICEPNSTRGLESLVVSEQNVIIPIPLQFSAPIADSTATAASVSTQLNLLLAALRKVRQLPS